MTRHVTVVGGGIAGLAAARTLAVAGASVRLVEGSDRLGGKIRTDEVDGRPFEAGPDAFLARVPHAAGLARELGLGDQLVSPATGQAMVWSRGALRPLPAGLVLGVPADFGPLRASGILSARGWARAALEPFLPGRPLRGDRAVGTYLAERYGREVAERLVDPLLGGINAGRADRLSLAAGAAQIHAVARGHRSVAQGLRAQRTTTTAAGPVFFSLAGGLGMLIAALVDDLKRRGVTIETRRPAGALDAIEGDGVVLAVPAPAAAGVLRSAVPAAAGLLDTIDHASVTLTTLTLPPDAFTARFEGSGFLVPRVDRHLMTACTVMTSKWAHLDSGADVVVRLSAGRRGDTRAIELTEDELVTRLRDELRRFTAVDAPPRAVRVERWIDGFPQYDVGHVERVAAIRALLPPGVAVAGAAYDGVGIPACIASGQAAAAAVLAVR